MHNLPTDSEIFDEVCRERARQGLPRYVSAPAVGEVMAAVRRLAAPTAPSALLAELAASIPSPGKVPAVATEDLAGAVWNGPNTSSQVDPSMGLPSMRGDALHTAYAVPTPKSK